MVNKVIVGVDFSEASRRALVSGHDWAQRLGVPLTAVHLLPAPVPVPGGASELVSLPPDASHLPKHHGVGWDQKWAEEGRAHALEQLNAWTEGFPGTAVKVAWGGPAEGLMAEADTDTLIVLGSVGHSTLENLLFGSTAIKVVRHAPCDVLVVRAPKT